MSKRKLTADDKKSLLIKFFQDKKQFFTLKELEKVVPKETGMNEKVVKDVLQQVVDDGLVDTEKVGTSNVFWSFPNKGKQDMERKCAKLKQKLHDLTKKIAELEAQKEKVSGQEDVSILQTENDLLKTKVMILRKTMKDESPEKMTPEEITQDLEKKQEMTPKLRDAANRWTDNVFTIKSWCKNKFNCEESVIDKQFRIPGDFDYIS